MVSPDSQLGIVIQPKVGHTTTVSFQMVLKNKTKKRCQMYVEREGDSRSEREGEILRRNKKTLKRELNTRFV